MPENSPVPRGGSGLPGCVILCAILLVFGGLVVLYTVVGRTQYRAIPGFTDETAAEYVIDTPSEAAVESARSKLSEIESAVSQNRAARVLFTAENLNTLIATLDVAKDFRGNTRVREITGEGLVVEMSQPLRKGVIDRSFRYLNAVFVFEPELRRRTIAFKLKDIRRQSDTIPEGFISNFAALDLFKLDPDIEPVADHVRSLRRVYTEGGHLVVETKIVTEE